MEAKLSILNKLTCQLSEKNLDKLIAKAEAFLENERKKMEESIVPAESAVLQLLKAKYLQYTTDKETMKLKEFGKKCLYKNKYWEKFRQMKPEFSLEFPDFVLVLEIDEKFHRKYDVNQELVRGLAYRIKASLQLKKKKPLLLLRFGVPGRELKVGGPYVVQLEQFMETSRANPPKHDTIVFLNYEESNTHIEWYNRKAKELGLNPLQRRPANDGFEELHWECKKLMQHENVQIKGLLEGTNYDSL